MRNRLTPLLVACGLWACQGEPAPAPDASGAAGGVAGAGGAAGLGGGAGAGPGAAAGSAGAGAGGGAGAVGGGAGAPAVTKLDVEPLYYPGQQAPFEHIADDVTLQVKRPPQGGFVLWVGADVAGTTTEQIEIRVRLRSVATGIIVAEESRSIAMQPADGEEGRMHPAPITMRNASNLPVCPNYGDENIMGVPLDLELSVSEPDAQPPAEGQVTRRVVLGCPAGSQSCACECSEGYVLGACTIDDTPVPEDL